MIERVRHSKHSLFVLSILASFTIMLIYWADVFLGAVGLRKIYHPLSFPISCFLLVLCGRAVLLSTDQDRKNLTRLLVIAFIFIWGLVVTLGLIGGFILWGFSVFAMLPITVMLLILGQLRLVGQKQKVVDWEAPTTVVVVLIAIAFVTGIGANYSGAAGTRVISSETSLNGRLYYLQAERTLSDGDVVTLFECNGFGMYCRLVVLRSISDVENGDPQFPLELYSASKFMTNPALDEVIIRVENKDIYTHRQ